MKRHDAWQPATVRAISDLSPTVREFELAPAEGGHAWEPGSHLELELMVDGRTERRCYSLIALAGDDRSTYRIAVKRLDAGRGGSRAMWQLAIGASLRVNAPANHFPLAGRADEWLLVAGGIGVTPLVGMARRLTQGCAPVRMCFTARGREELVYRTLLQAALGDRLRTFDSMAGERIDCDAEVAALAPQAQALVCGPLGLLDAMQAAWTRAGRDPSRLRFETFGSGGHAASEAFWVELPRHRLRVEVPSDRSLLDVLTEHGIETLFDCRRGECGLCALDVVSVQGRIDHRDVFLGDRERAASTRLCACVSRVSGGGVVLDTAYRPD